MLQYNYVVEYFREQSAHQYQLFAIAGGGAFKFLAEDFDKGEVLALRSYHYDIPTQEDDVTALQSLITSDSLLRWDYRQVKLCLFSELFTIIPGDLFDSTQVSLYLKNIIALPPGVQACWDRIPNSDMYCVYPVEEAMLEYLSSFFSRLSVYHWVSPLLAGLIPQTDLSSRTQFFIHVYRQHLLVTVFDKRNLLFCNAYAYQNADEFLYFVMLVFDQLKLNRERTAVRLSGDISRDSELFKKLYAYIRHQEFMPFPSYLSASPALTAQSPHLFFDLYNIKLCES